MKANDQDQKALHQHLKQGYEYVPDPSLAHIGSSIKSLSARLRETMEDSRPLALANCIASLLATDLMNHLNHRVVMSATLNQQSIYLSLRSHSNRKDHWGMTLRECGALAGGSPSMRCYPKRNIGSMTDPSRHRVPTGMSGDYQKGPSRLNRGHSANRHP